jgi:hypothetical protein
MLCALISSTALDLPVHRDAVRDACLRQNFFPLMMEEGAPSDVDPVRLSRELVDRADVYIVILGFRYGVICVGVDKSFMHLELDRANERGIPKLVFLMADDHPLSVADVDVGPAAERVNALREQLRREQNVAFFSSPEQLRAFVIDGLFDIRRKMHSTVEAATATPRPPAHGRRAAKRRIFLSYRREETDWQASWLAETLANHFGADVIFKDADSIDPGDDFVEVINDAVKSCDVLLALIWQ